MANTVPSPNMNMPVPVVGTDPGPDWANNVNASLSIVDSHDHSTGKGVPVTPSGLNINADLPFNDNNGISYRSVRFTAQGSPIAGASDVGCLYEAGVDLYYNDGNGNQIRITQGGSVSGSAGTITGLPSGTASASYSAGTFTFQGATNTPATMNVGPIVTGAAVANAKTVTWSAAAGQAVNWAGQWPQVAGVANQVMVSDSGSNLSWSLGLIPLGTVIATFPNLAGAYTSSGTTAADAWGFVKCQGQTIADATSPMNGVVIPNINNTVFLAGNTTSGTSGGAATAALITNNLPSHTHDAGSFATSVGVTGGTASLIGNTTFASTSHTHGFNHNHQWGYEGGPGYNIYTLTTSSATSATFNSSATTLMGVGGTFSVGAGFFNPISSNLGGLYTTGALNDPGTTGPANAVTGGPSGSATVGISSTAASMTGSNSVTGTSAATGSGSSFSILPTYITSVYLMRIK